MRVIFASDGSIEEKIAKFQNENEYTRTNQEIMAKWNDITSIPMANSNGM